MISVYWIYCVMVCGVCRFGYVCPEGIFIKIGIKKQKKIFSS